MEFRTKIKWPEPAFTLSPLTRMTMLGSCFAEHIGHCMERGMMDVCVNPFGVLYNPVSILAVLKEAVSGKEPDRRLFFDFGDESHCWLTDSSFSCPERGICVSKFMSVCRETVERLQTTDVVFVTLGTNRCYELVSEALVVGNCHKQPGAMFVERQLNVSDVVVALKEIHSLLRGLNSSVKIVWTVSPYRYLKYGFHGNQLGKSILLVAIDELCKESLSDYFPAYEIMMDELRDYRFYADDMVHPAPLAVAYIWECFKNYYFTPEALEYVMAAENLSKALEHRPLHPSSDAYIQFLHKILFNMEQLKQKYPTFALTSQCDRLKDQLKKLEV